MVKPFATTLRCRIFGHQGGAPVLNEGLYFTRCERCSRDLIRQPGGDWYAVPPGMRVVWKEEGRHAIAPMDALNLAHGGRWAQMSKKPPRS
ncbi:hypothetical protein G4G27_14760 [Sphingomonas sp. So64.6b]|uniref:hypothetical protein n=1 Tax=Sphingomonas sp. So64.6b TaxID=2997354 RepID=UPI001603CB85|nr:hypothetical protein [Sphingomonas sp. So64.6b]QNA85116.1 hypothetical protein G4G27_14760 [Sphingomonas sp. So64.6b]